MIGKEIEYKRRYIDDQSVLNIFKIIIVWKKEWMIFQERAHGTWY